VELLSVFAMMGTIINDLLAILSVLGSLILFFGSFSDAPLRQYGKIAEWSILGLIFGAFFQISMAITGTTPKKIGFAVEMPPTVVNGLLGLSFLLLMGRWWIKRNRYKFM
jgi:hypothetical protein